ncbi:MAG: efflux RND transporter periplasmic adaptor subunit [Ruminobacter sp.]|jgi:membrane fusion protein (multidrug efflux system)|uniref:Membrane fusion protein, multidrug efflux system n=1 Tax=Ruminobacter amylophilus TaxID=867 RepID=A0A662ZLK1_9GAMM|nr:MULTISPECIES: efflux RND transporter periplasmic adaptor subunit [Ruminobacter]MBQ3775790.1 efflux RND transporter periplasmic adaptor subunit [Ruminobacter sp.]SFP78566.1 membrane fusion protein, multidrug efflux system [Ruminobacter amylophilus]
MRKWQIAVPLATILVFGAVIGFNIYKEKKIQEYLANMKPPVNPVTTMKIDKAPWQEAVSAIGFIEPNQGIDVSSEVSGSITGLYFDSGDVVKQNQVLVQVNDSVEKANYEASRAKADVAEKKFIRYSALIKKGNVSQMDLDNAKADYEAAIADAKSIKAKIEKLQIKAPFEGKLGIRNVYVGQYVQPGSKIAHLEDNSKVKVRFTVSQNDVEKIKLGQKVVLNVDAFPDETFEGEISAIEVVMNYEAGILQVQGTIPNPQSKLITGMYAKVNVILPSEEEQIAIPKTAISYNLYGTSVYRVKTDDKGQKISEQVNVTTGNENGDKVVITSGLNPGDVIVTEGLVRLSNGSYIEENDKYNLDKVEKVPEL